MRLVAAALSLAAVCVTTNVALAVSTDDVKWINQCVKDNKGLAAAGVVLKYCTCMVNKMEDSETQSVTQWEKTHAAERKACDAEAGWK
jgi:DhnA family fructose-bisphosphate aldolase class Ia